MVWLTPLKKKESIPHSHSLTLSDLDKIMHVKALYNRLPGLQAVSNKKTLGKIFQRWHKHYESDFNFAPITFSLPEESEQLKHYMKKHPNTTFIAKPQGGAEGCGIFLLKQ